MDKITKCLGIALIVLVASICASAIPTCAPKKMNEGTYDGETFTIVDDRAFDVAENVYVKGKPGASYFSDPVTVYVTVNRKWTCGDNVEQKGYVAKVTGSVYDGGLVNLGKFSAGIYDVFIDEDGDGIYDCCTPTACDNGCDGDNFDGDGECDPCFNEVVDSSSFKCFGFEVLPELATAALLGSGLVAFGGYFVVSRKR